MNLWFRFGMVAIVVFCLSKGNPQPEIQEGMGSACTPFLKEETEAEPSPIKAIVERDLTVSIVLPCGAAEKAGLNGGDKILAVNGQKVSSIKELKQALAVKPKTIALGIREFITKQNTILILEPSYGSGHDARLDRLGNNTSNTGGKLPAAARL